ncbi:hypothetical protein V8C42DRAFT_312682 [Trichoderma barbatum]
MARALSVCVSVSLFLIISLFFSCKGCVIRHEPKRQTRQKDKRYFCFPMTGCFNCPWLDFRARIGASKSPGRFLRLRGAVGFYDVSRNPKIRIPQACPFVGDCPYTTARLLLRYCF